MKITTWNVNGIRACEKKGFWEWLNESSPDILCIQETKAWPEQLVNQDFITNKKYFTYYATAEKKGYSGVALFSKRKLKSPIITIGIGIDKFDIEGRTIIAEYDKFIVFSCYFPNGQRDHNRVPYKLEYSKAIAKKALVLKKKTNKEIIIAGDYNTAHTEIDLKNPKSNKNSTGFLPIERDWIDKFIKQGFFDIFRLHHPEKEGEYTWWTYRSNCRAKNVGWRIDYIFLTELLIKKTKKIYHCPNVNGSDHCPVTIELKP